jgi:formamidopyrimidine-DNA glycosylase
MPELPEVETIRRELDYVLKNKTIVKVTVKYPNQIRGISVAGLKNKIKGLEIKSVTRRAKLIVIELQTRNHAESHAESRGKFWILVHLKMTGQLIWHSDKSNKLIYGGHPIKVAPEDLPNKFTHIWLDFKTGDHLYFNDIRRFGYWQFIKNKEDLEKVFAKYGPEPLDPKFTAKKFIEIIKAHPTRTIKQIMMNQEWLAGVGNIYADESAWGAKLLPMHKVGVGLAPTQKGQPQGLPLRDDQIKSLYRSLIKILKKAVKYRGTSVDNYVDIAGQPGGFVKFLEVYGREKKECRRCGGIIKKIRHNGRGTHYCPGCQK